MKLFDFCLVSVMQKILLNIYLLLSTNLSIHIHNHTPRY